jgi:DNA-binding MarR family transcriptional regulator
MSREAGSTSRDAVVGTIEVQIAVMARNTELLRRRSMPPGELDRAAYLILRALCTLGSADINGLAAVLGLDASTVGRQITGLVEEKLVTRSPAEDDRRRAVIVVSDEGRRLLDLTIASRRERTTQLMSDWDVEDLRRFGELLAHYNSAVSDRYMTGLKTVEAEPGARPGLQGAEHV